MPGVDVACARGPVVQNVSLVTLGARQSDIVPDSRSDAMDALELEALLSVVVLVVLEAVREEPMRSQPAKARVARVRLQIPGVEIQASALLAYQKCPKP